MAGGGGQQQSPVQTTTSYNGVSAYAAPYVNQMLGQAQALTNQPYQAYQGQQNAAPTDLQNQSYQAGSQLSTGPNFGIGSNLNTAAGMGALNTAQQAGEYGGLGAMAGMSYGQNAQNPNAVSSYMNPYLQNTLAPSLQLLNQQFGQQGVANQAQATQQGAYGGGRQALMQGLNQQNQALATNQLVGNAYNQAYNTANQNMQQAASLGMQGAGLGLQGIGAQQAGYGLAGNTGVNLANIGNQQLGAQQNIINTQNALGTQQQQNQQNVLNTQYQNYQNQLQYPYQQLSFMQNMLSGLPMQTNTQSVYAGAPTTAQSLSAMGLGAYGLSKLANADGGLMKSYAEGGVTSPENVQSIVSQLSDQQLQQVLQHPASPEELQAAQAEMAMRQSERQGLAGAFNQLPQQNQQQMVQAANGGVMRFSGDEEDNNPQTGQLVSPGNPSAYNQALQQAMQYNQQIGTFKGDTMTDADYNNAISKRFAMLQGLGGADPYAGFQQTLAQRDTDRTAALEQGKGLAALQAIPAVLQPGGTMRGLGAAAGTLGKSLTDLYDSDRREKQATQNMQLSIADAQRKERMGLGKESIAAADQARKDKADANTAAFNKLKSQAEVAAKIAQAARPVGTGGAGGAGKGPKLDEQLAAAEVAHEMNPTDETLKRVTALRRAKAEAKTSDIGTTKADIARETLMANEDKNVQAAMKGFKFDPDYMEAKQAGDTERAAQLWDAELQRQRAVYRSKQTGGNAASVNNNSSKITPIKLD